MLKSIRKLWRDKRGNVLMLAGMSLPVLVGSAGLAVDTIQWSMFKRDMQRAADSSAFAGVYARAAGENVTIAVTTEASRYNESGVTLRTAPVITFPASVAGTFENAVQVQLTMRQILPFSSMFVRTAPTITTTATAAMVDIGRYCVRALRSDNSPGLIIGGSTTTTMGCRAQSNSRAATNAVSTNGGAYTFTSEAVAGVGGLPSSINGVSKLIPHSPSLSDPFAGRYPTTPTSQCNKQVQNNQTTLQPGCYRNFSFSGQGTYTLQPGVYFLDSTDFQVAGGVTVQGTGVTIILTGTNPGSVKMNGGSEVNISAPTSGTYANMLFIQASNATTDNDNTFNGSALTRFDGAFYFPKGQVNLTGSSGNSTKCVMLVGYTVKFSGNANVQNDTVGCNSAQTQSGKSIRLIA